MKKILKIMGIITLISFSFFYIDKVAEVIKENDSLMQEINNVKDKYKITPINGVVKNNTIIPGINGRIINVEKSYKKMREKGIFDKNLIQYDIISPKISLINNRNKYIISGNTNKKYISIIFIIKDDKYLEKLEQIVINKNIIINYFVDYDYLINNTTKIKKLNNCEIYNYGDNGYYSPDNLLFANNLLSRITNNNAIYCLVNYPNKKTLNLCSNNNLYTIYPSIIITNNSYNTIKKELQSGNIILMDLNKNNIIELSIIINYIEGKGLNIVGLSKLLSE